jgi:HSP20 family protein
MPIIKWEPFGELDRLFGEHAYVSMFPKLGWDLAIDLYEEGGTVIAKINLPGVKPEELDITVDEDLLNVSGSREEEQETDKKDYYSKEIRRGSFSRSVSLPKSINVSKVEAEYADGILKVTMPVLEGKQKKTAQVKVVKK